MIQGTAGTSRQHPTWARRVYSYAERMVTNWPARNHKKRYILGAVVSVGGIWALSAAYLLLTPKSYVSKWTLILPGSGAGVSFQLENIGKADSISASPFSSPSLSPKVLYKEVASSDAVLSAAAKSLKMSPSTFGDPQIKLIDETALMLFQIKANSPKLAQEKANAVISAFDKQLDKLRHDEIERRAISVREIIKGYEASLQAARQRIFDQQQKSGLISVEQFKEATSRLDDFQKKLSEVRADAARLDASQATLVNRLGISAQMASKVLALSAEPLFVKAFSDYADSSVLVAEHEKLLGSQNPLLIQSKARLRASIQLLKEATKHAGINGDHVSNIIAVIGSKGREDLLKELISGEAQLQGKNHEVEALSKEVEILNQHIQAMTVDAARLEDLKKDHLVAEAVFSSALARLDTNKADIYSSYPIVQVLSPPDLPEKPSQPRLLFAILGGIFGSLLVTAAWVFAWLRQLFVLRREGKRA